MNLEKEVKIKQTKSMQNKYIKLLVFVSMSPLFAFAQSYTDGYGEEVYSYDSIVEQLSSNRAQQAEVYEDPFQDVAFHLGAGFSQSLLNIRAPGKSKAVNLSGVEIRMGINLFNPQWIAEGTLRNYNDSRRDGINYQLREFEAKIIHTKPFSDKAFYRVGSGLAARYLKSDIEERGNNKSYRTPSLILNVGSGLKLAQHISVAGDLAFKTSLVNDTIDKNTLDFTVRVDTSF